MGAKKHTISMVHKEMALLHFSELDRWQYRKAKAWARSKAADPKDFVYTSFTLKEAGEWTSTTKQNVHQNTIPLMQSENMLVRIARGTKGHASLYAVNQVWLAFIEAYTQIRKEAVNA